MLSHQPSVVSYAEKDKSYYHKPTLARSKKDRCQRRFQADFNPPSFRTHLLGACAKVCRYAYEPRLQNRSFVGFQGIPPLKTPKGEASPGGLWGVPASWRKTLNATICHWGTAQTCTTQLWAHTCTNNTHDTQHTHNTHKQHTQHIQHTQHTTQHTPHNAQHTQHNTRTAHTTLRGRL